jgi:hypothetical protein
MRPKLVCGDLDFIRSFPIRFEFDPKVRGIVSERR